MNSPVADYRTDAVVIGAGVIGLATARALALAGLETVVIDRENHIGSGISSRNSEVIHAGIYYPQRSLKAKLCVRGKALLYHYLQTRSVPFRRCGKLIVAGTEGEAHRLEEISNRARSNGVSDLEALDREELRKLEPALSAARGLLSPSTGIVDSHQFMLALQGDIEAAGGAVALSAPVVGGYLSRCGEHIVSVGGEEPALLGCRILVVAAGLQARDLLLQFSGISEACIPPQYFAKGHYYSYPGTPPFERLVYPLPQPGGLGVHATLDLAGQVRFGPDVRWVKTLDFGFSGHSRQAFVDSIRAYYPELDPERLQEGYTGIRPKIVGPGEQDGDFLFLSEREHGLPGFMSLHGIESPGLTAALAIAEVVVAQILCQEEEIAV